MVDLQHIEFGAWELTQARRGASALHLVDRLERGGEVGQRVGFLGAPHHLATEIEAPQVAQRVGWCLMGMVEDFQLHGLAVGGEVVVGLADVLVDVLWKRGDIGFVGGKLRQGDVETGALDGIGRQRRHDPGKGAAARHVGEAERHPLAGGSQVSGYCLQHLLVTLVGVGADHIEHAADPAGGNAGLLGGPRDGHREDGKGTASDTDEVVAHGCGQRAETVESVVVQKLVPLVGLVVGVVDVAQGQAFRLLVQRPPGVLDVVEVIVLMEGNIVCHGCKGTT